MLEQSGIYTTRDIWKFFQIAFAERVVHFWQNFQVPLIVLIALLFIRLTITAA